MNRGFLLKLLAWSIALALVALPVVGVLNGWFASERWPITRLNVRAEFNHVSAAQIRAAAEPLLGKGFFAMRLDRMRDAIARLPWVEHAEARKRWPDTIDLVVYEQQPYARWNSDRLINRAGKVFSVPASADLIGLPRLAGPDDRIDDVIRFYADTVREFAGSGLGIAAVTLSPRGGWRLDLASGAAIEVGREDAHARLKRFLDVWPRLVGSHPQAPAYIDLRYENGFAMRWAEAAPAPQPPPASPDSRLGIRNSAPPSRNALRAAPPRDPDRIAMLAHPTPDVESRLRPVPNPESRIPALP